MFKKLEAAWDAFCAPPIAVFIPKSSPKPPQWLERLRQAFSAALASLPKPKEIALPQPQQLPAWRVEVQLRQVWEEFTQPIRLPEITLTQPPGEEAWTSQLDQLWTCYQQVPLPDPLAVILPPPRVWQFSFTEGLEWLWSSFQLELLALPAPPASLRALQRQEQKRKPRPRPGWMQDIDWVLGAALEPVGSEPTASPVFQPIRLSWEPRLISGIQRALEPPPAPLAKARFREPEPRFADLPAWEQRLWQAWWCYERPTSAPAPIETQPQPVRMGWENKLAGLYRDISGLPEIATSRLALATISTLPLQPLGFEEKLRLALNSPRLKEAKRRQSHTAPTHKWKKSQRQAKTGPGWMHTGRWTVQFDRKERIITATSWTGQKTRKMVVERIPLYGWKAQRIRPQAREGLELAQELFETRAGLEVTGGLQKPRWLSEEEWLWKRAQPEHAEMELFLASEELARDETAGNPDLRRKFAAL